MVVLTSNSLIASDAVGPAQQGKRMRQRLRRVAALGHALRDVMPCQRAVAADDVGRAQRHRLEHRLADLHRHRMRRRLHAIGAGVARAALDGVELERDALADELEHLFRLAADLLHPRMAGNVIADLA
jgi:hypothetical protein